MITMVWDSIAGEGTADRRDGAVTNERGKGGVGEEGGALKGQGSVPRVACRGDEEEAEACSSCCTMHGHVRTRVWSQSCRLKRQNGVTRARRAGGRGGLQRQRSEWEQGAERGVLH